jgi:protein phosphatase-4 regulatory subunit 3
VTLLFSLPNPDFVSADTLIVWTEINGKDYALSFQDVEGCTEVWEFILEVRRHLRSTHGKL